MLEALLRVPSRDTLALAVTQLEVEPVQHRACEVALLIGNAIVDKQPESVAKAMEQVLEVTKDDNFKNYAKHLIAKAKQTQGE